MVDLIAIGHADVLIDFQKLSRMRYVPGFFIVIQEKKSMPFTQQTFNTVSPPAAKEEKRIFIVGIQMKLKLYYAS